MDWWRKENLSDIERMVRERLAKQDGIAEIRIEAKAIEAELDAERKSLDKVFRTKAPKNAPKAVRVKRAKQARRVSQLRAFSGLERMTDLVVERCHEVSDGEWW